MGLSFTNIEDRNGAAVYFISDGLTTTTERLTLIANEIAARNPETQLVLLDNPERGDSQRVADFYDIQSFPAILIIMDDDTSPYSWTRQLPTSDQIAYQLSTINGGMRSS